MEADKAVEEIERVAGLVRLERLASVPASVIGVDAAYDEESGVVVGAAVVVDRASLTVVDQATVVVDRAVEYKPGLLASREAPAVIAAIEALDLEPQLVVCDGHGYAHPRRSGLACHVGVALDVPTIGCGKNRLVGSHNELGAERGA